MEIAEGMAAMEAEAVVESVAVSCMAPAVLNSWSSRDADLTSRVLPNLLQIRGVKVWEHREMIPGLHKEAKMQLRHQVCRIPVIMQHC